MFGNRVNDLSKLFLQSVYLFLDLLGSFFLLARENGFTQKWNYREFGGSGILVSE
jgi:hypothetical protein